MASPTFSEVRAYIEVIIEYRFANPLLLEEALLAKPSTVGARYFTEYNKPLAIVGDGAIRLLATHDCYLARMPKADHRKQALENDRKLAELGRAQGIDQFIVKNGGTVMLSNKMVATAVETIVGAVFVDSHESYEAAKRAMVAFGVLEG